MVGGQCLRCSGLIETREGQGFGILRDKLSFSKCFNVLNYDVILLVLEWTSEPVADGNLCMW